MRVQCISAYKSQIAQIEFRTCDCDALVAEKVQMTVQIYARTATRDRMTLQFQELSLANRRVLSLAAEVRELRANKSRLISELTAKRFVSGCPALRSKKAVKILKALS